MDLASSEYEISAGRHNSSTTITNTHGTADFAIARRSAGMFTGLCPVLGVVAAFHRSHDPIHRQGQHGGVNQNVSCARSTASHSKRWLSQCGESTLGRRSR